MQTTIHEELSGSFGKRKYAKQNGKPTSCVKLKKVLQSSVCRKRPHPRQISQMQLTKNPRNVPCAEEQHAIPVTIAKREFAATTKWSAFAVITVPPEILTLAFMYVLICFVKLHYLHVECL